MHYGDIFSDVMSHVNGVPFTGDLLKDITKEL
jgi:hypothetical protein